MHKFKDSKQIDHLRTKIIHEVSKPQSPTRRSKALPSVHNRCSSQFPHNFEILPRDISHRQDSRPRCHSSFEKFESKLREILGIPDKKPELPSNLDELAEFIQRSSQEVSKSDLIKDLEHMKLNMVSNQEKLLGKVLKEGGLLYRTQSGLLQPQLCKLYDQVVKKTQGARGEITRQDLELGLPTARQEVEVLIGWLENMTKIYLIDDGLSVEERVRRAQLIYTACFREVVRQVSVQCIERGILIQRIWNASIDMANLKDQDRLVQMQSLQDKVQQIIDSKIKELKERCEKAESQIEVLKKIIEDKDMIIIQAQVDAIKMQEVKKSHFIPLEGLFSRAKTKQPTKFIRKNTEKLIEEVNVKVFAPEAEVIKGRPLVMIGYIDESDNFYKQRIIHKSSETFHVNHYLDELQKVIPFTESASMTENPVLDFQEVQTDDLSIQEVTHIIKLQSISTQFPEMKQSLNICKLFNSRISIKPFIIKKGFIPEAVSEESAKSQENSDYEEINSALEEEEINGKTAKILKTKQNAKTPIKAVKKKAGISKTGKKKRVNKSNTNELGFEKTKIRTGSLESEIDIDAIQKRPNSQLSNISHQINQYKKGSTESQKLFQPNESKSYNPTPDPNFNSNNIQDSFSKFDMINPYPSNSSLPNNSHPLQTLVNDSKSKSPNQHNLETYSVDDSNNVNALISNESNQKSAKLPLKKSKSSKDKLSKKFSPLRTISKPIKNLPPKHPNPSSHSANPRAESSTEKPEAANSSRNPSPLKSLNETGNEHEHEPETNINQPLNINSASTSNLHQSKHQISHSLSKHHKSCQVSIDPIPFEEYTRAQVISSLQQLNRILNNIQNDKKMKNDIVKDHRATDRAAKLVKTLEGLFLNKDKKSRENDTNALSGLENRGSDLGSRDTQRVDKPNSSIRTKEPSQSTIVDEFNLGIVQRKLIQSHPGPKLLSLVLQSITSLASIQATLSLKSLIKTINSIYSEKISLSRENISHKKYDTSMVLYDFLTNMYGLKTVAETKFKQVIVSTLALRNQNARVSNFSKFLGFESNYVAEDWNFYLSLYEYLDYNNFGANVANDLNHFSTLASAGFCVRMFFEKKIQDDEIERICKFVAGMVEAAGPRKSSKGEVVNTDKFLNEILKIYIALKDRVYEKLNCKVSRNELITQEHASDIIKALNPKSLETFEKIFENHSILRKDEDGELSRLIRLESLLNLIIDYNLSD